MFENKLILASTSPRRKDLLSLLTKDFIVIAPDVDEKFDSFLDVEQVPLYLSKLKALAVAEKYPNSTIIACDTVVIKDNKIYGKPKDKDDARFMLKSLSGNVHKVISAVSIYYNHNVESFKELTLVYFNDISEKELEEYLVTDEPYDKAGSYGIQGNGGKFVDNIKGDIYNVIGLPLFSLYSHLEKIEICELKMP
jgi:septum formation protein